MACLSLPVLTAKLAVITIVSLGYQANRAPYIDNPRSNVQILT